MKKFYLLTFALLFTFQLAAMADKDYTPPKVPNAADVLKDVKDDDKNCKDISPTHKGNCGDKGEGNGGDDNGKGNGGKDNGKGNGGKDNGKGNDGKDNGKGNDGKDNGKGNDGKDNGNGKDK